MNQDAIYDARQLGVPKMLLLGLQHMFAMFAQRSSSPLSLVFPFPQRCCLQVWALCSST